MALWIVVWTWVGSGEGELLKSWVLEKVFGVLSSSSSLFVSYAGRAANEE